MNPFVIMIFLALVDGNCKECHPPNSLTEKGVVGSQKKIMEEMGEGVKIIASFEIKGVGLLLKWLGIEWVKRGRHSELDMEKCEDCHKNHVISIYPNNGKRCEGCHKWLGDVSESGYGGNFTGSIIPVNLLASGAHSKIFREGFVKKRRGIKVQLLNPGCRGCHNLMKDEHGAITQCTDCHDFSGTGIHNSHTVRIEGTAGLNGMESETPCSFCHFRGNNRYRAGCYNCHLSGHNPALYYWRTK